MDVNESQARALQFLADHFLFNYLCTEDEIVDCNFLHFVNSHNMRKTFFTCPACNGSTLYCGSFAPKDKRLPLTPIYLCTTCGTLRTPQPFIEQEVSEDNDNFSAMNNSLSFHLAIEKRNRVLAANLLDTFLKPMKRILEIGCGPGWLIDEAQKRGKECVGYDLSTTSVEWGMTNLHLNLKNEKFTRSSSVAPFDVLICIMVFEHLQSPDELADAIASHCRRSKAPALISVPITDNLDTLAKSLKNPADPHSLFCYAPAHTCHYTQDGFTRLWKRHGASNIQRLRIKNSWPFLFQVDF